MILKGEKVRKIAANYIYLPGFPLVRNGYLVWKETGVVDVVNTGGVIREIQGLEFYGGLIVPDYVKEDTVLFQSAGKMIPALEVLYVRRGREYSGLILIEGADLRELTWHPGVALRPLCW